MPNIFCIEEIPRSITIDSDDERWITFGEKCAKGLMFVESINSNDEFTIVFTQDTQYVSPFFFVGFLREAQLLDKVSTFDKMKIMKVGGLSKPSKLIGVSMEVLFCKIVAEFLKLKDESENTKGY